MKKQLRELSDQQIPVGIPVDFTNNSQNRFPITHPFNQHLQTFQIYPHQRHHIPPEYYFHNQHPQQLVTQQLYLDTQQSHGQPNNRLATFDKPEAIKCPCCQMDVVTIMNYESGNTTYGWGAGVCVLTMCCCGSPCCCCVPFMMKGCMDKNHYCPQCGFNIIRKHQKCCEF